MEHVIGFFVGGFFGFLVGLFLTYLYGAYKVRQVMANAGSMAKDAATGIIQKGVMKAYDKYRSKNEPQQEK